MIQAFFHTEVLRNLSCRIKTLNFDILQRPLIEYLKQLGRKVS